MDKADIINTISKLISNMLGLDSISGTSSEFDEADFIPQLAEVSLAK